MKKIAAYVLAIALLSSCNEEEATVNNIQDNEQYQSILSSVPTHYDYGDLANELDNGNLIGIIELIRTDNDYIQVYGDQTTYLIEEIRSINAVNTYAYGSFWDSQVNPLSLGSNIMINARPINEYEIGQYDGEEDFDFEFGSGYNVFKIDSSNVINEFIDSLQFSSPIVINGLSNGTDTIDISDGMSITWTGNPINQSNRIMIDFDASYYPNDYQETDSSFIGFAPTLYENTNSFIIGGPYQNTSNIWPDFMLANLTKDIYYDIIITGFENHYLTTSTGKDILVVMVSESRRTVFVTE
jgi:hypothetical protein